MKNYLDTHNFLLRIGSLQQFPHCVLYYNSILCFSEVSKNPAGKNPLLPLTVAAQGVLFYPEGLQGTMWNTK